MNISAFNARAGADTDVMRRSGALDQQFSLDVQGVDTLRRAVRSTPEEGLKQVSRQFEALFMNMVLKSMRDATPSSGLLESPGQKMYQSLLDQQLSQSLSGRGLGLAEAMQAQLRRQLPSGQTAAGAALPSPSPDALAGPSPAPSSGKLAGLSSPPEAAPSPVAQASRAARKTELNTRDRLLATVDGALRGAATNVADYLAASAQEVSKAGHAIRSVASGFMERLGTSAQAASKASGVDASLILAQAALESGWGKREIRGEDGKQSFNLFGIKADRSWNGPVAKTTTTEFVDGQPQKVQAKFRAYGSYEEAFSDYANFIARNPRYAGVLSASNPVDAAHGLQRAGYATDPQYAQKLIRIMQKLV